MRIRALPLVLAVTVAAFLSPARAAYATTALKASITCDSTTNTISTSVSGGQNLFTPNMPVNVRFLVYYGSYVSATTESLISAKGSSITVPTTTAADGSVSVAGYTRSWQASDYVFYTETVRVTVLSTAGAELGSSQATCTRDLRTTVTLDCDQEAHTITARSAGVGFTQMAVPGTVRVEYEYSSTQQAAPGYPTFTRVLMGTPDVVHSVATTETGAWSDLGYVHNITTDPYYRDETVVVVVKDPSNSLVIGRGSAFCVYADHRSA
jgi:hypothetical protein